MINNIAYNKKKTFTVSELNTYLKAYIEYDEILSDIWLNGEISQCKYYHKGNQFYFNLVDQGACMNCVVYSNFIPLLTIQPQNGQSIFARGKMKFFQKRGQLIFQVAYIDFEGPGKNKLSFDVLKKKLLSEGLFDEKNKKEIPTYPEKVGVITSYESAAMWDFLRSTQNHGPFFTIHIFPAIVQGDKAPISVISALRESEKHNLDSVALIRGGGAETDLACFNDELLVRAIAQCSIPVITGIGHEIDRTLADFAADKSCATPTAVAEYCNAPFKDLKLNLRSQIEKCKQMMKTDINHLINQSKTQLNALQMACKLKFDYSQEKLEQLMKQLAYSNPLHQLEKGYAILSKKNTDKSIRSIQDIRVNDMIKTQLHDGELLSNVEEVVKYER